MNSGTSSPDFFDTQNVSASIGDFIPTSEKIHEFSPGRWHNVPAFALYKLAQKKKKKKTKKKKKKAQSESLAESEFVYKKLQLSPDLEKEKLMSEQASREPPGA